MREKRGLEGGDDELPERKRPALARYIIYFWIHLCSDPWVLFFFCSLLSPSPLQLNLASGEKSKYNSVRRCYASAYPF